MDIKERYYRAKFLNNKIKRLSEDLESLDIDISAIDTTKDSVQTSNKSDLSDRILRINNLKENIKECKQELEEYKEYALKEIDKLQVSNNNNEYDVMYYKYVMLLPSYEIANKMNYTVNWVNKLHGYALNRLRKFENNHR